MTEEHSLAAPPMSASARPHGRAGAAFGYRFFLLLALGFAWVIPGMVQPRFLFGVLAWDAAVLILWALDFARLPRPAQIEVTRRWRAPLALSVPSEVEITVWNRAGVPMVALVTDDVPSGVRATPPALALTLPAGREAQATYTAEPVRRGAVTIGNVYLRYQSPLRLAERWAAAPLAQKVIVFPNLAEAKQHVIYLVRSRQVELEKRYARVRGQGREFDSLREYRPGDEFRNICWTATARRGKLVTKTYQVERSQPVWLVLDSGRLMRARIGGLSKLDYAVNAALSLAEVALHSGDRVGLLAYGRAPQCRVPLGRGSAQARQVLDSLAMVHEEAAEADHLRAAGMLAALQHRRSLVVWITDLAETAVTPEVIEAAMQLTSRHLVLFVVIGQPDLQALAARLPATVEEMFRTTAGQEVVHRRELLLAALRARGALALQAETGTLSPLVVNEYLRIKERNQL